MGSYLGGIATLIAVFITISDNNKKIAEQRELENEHLGEQKKYAIRPYLDTRYIFFNEEAETGVNDRIFDINEGIVKKVRYGLTPVDKQSIKIKQQIVHHVYLKYTIRNIGAGSAVDMEIVVNGFHEKIAIAKDETINCFFLISIGKENHVPISVILDYWDVEKRAHYNQLEEIEIRIDGSEQTVESKKIVGPTEIENP